jgi:NADH-quinone oxidoreductase subunit N
MNPQTPEALQKSFDLAAVAPELTLTLFALAVLLAGAFFADAMQRRLLPLLALLGACVSAASTAGLWNRNLTFGDPGTAIYVADNFALFFKFVFLLALVAAILISGRFLSPRSGDSHIVAGEYYGLLMLATVGMMFVSGARDLLVLFLGIETLSIALYVLAGFARKRILSNESALKYFLLGAFAAGFLLYGIALIYYSTGATLFTQIAANIASGQVTLGDGTTRAVSHPLLLIGMAMLLIGLGFKAALVPFHQWTPDVYEGAPTPVTAFMAVGAKAAALAAFLRVFPGVFGSLHERWFWVVLVMAVLTMTVGNVVAISQRSLKRMLAYSSIAHAGYLLIGVLASSLATRNGMTENAINASGAVLFYMLAYALMNLGAFAVLVYLENTRQRDEDSEDANITVDELNGLAWRQPLVAAAMTVFLLSLAGIPPTAGFFGKMLIFREAVGQGLIGLALVGVLNSVISVYYYLRPVLAMYAPEKSPGSELAAGGASISAGGAAVLRPSRALSLGVGVAMLLCALSVVLMVVVQSAFMPYVQEAAASQANAPALTSIVEVPAVP